MKKRGIIFDLDGTLWDTVEQIVPAWNKILTQHKTGCELTVRDAQAMMGKTASEIAAVLMPHLPKETREEILKECCEEEYRVLRKIGGTLYPDLIETLTVLHEKYFLAVVSNCLEGYIETFLDYHSLHEFFDDTECAGHTGKPKGENIALTVMRNGLEKAVYVGDTQGDFDAARLAGIPFIHASYGFGKVDNADCSISSLHDLTKVAAELLEQ